MTSSSLRPIPGRGLFRVCSDRVPFTSGNASTPAAAGKVIDHVVHVSRLLQVTGKLGRSSTYGVHQLNICSLPDFGNRVVHAPPIFGKLRAN